MFLKLLVAMAPSTQRPTTWHLVNTCYNQDPEPSYFVKRVPTSLIDELCSKKASRRPKQRLGCKQTQALPALFRTTRPGPPPSGSRALYFADSTVEPTHLPNQSTVSLLSPDYALRAWVVERRIRKSLWSKSTGQCRPLKGWFTQLRQLTKV